jgi:O-succinylbenzoic acid--CoA ligase
MSFMMSDPLIHFNNQAWTFSGFASFCKAQLKNRPVDSNTPLYRFFSDWIEGKETFAVQTSGSTGAPHSRIINRQQMERSASTTLSYLRLEEGTDALLCLPVQFIAGMMMIVRAWVGKMNLIMVHPDRNPLKNLTSRPGFAAMTPMQVQATLDAGEIKFFPEKLIIGGAPLSVELADALRGIDAEIYQTYGMTETITHIAMQPISPQYHPDLIPLPGVQISRDDRGCLVARTPWTNEPVITNDLIDLHPDGSFRWLGRTDHVINSGGIKIIPEEYERKAGPIIQLPFFVYGMEHDLFGTQLVIFIESANINTAGEEEIKQNIRNSEHKLLVPSKVVFLPEFIYTETGKINRGLTVGKYRGSLDK